MKKYNPRILNAVLKQIKSRPGFEDIGIEQYRLMLEKSASMFRAHKNIKKHRFTMASLEAAWLEPSDYKNKDIVLYIHGGGFIAGSIKTHKDIASRLAIASGAKVLLFNYRLAPEHPFPCGLEDVKTIYTEIADLYSSSHKISIAGDSAGACLGLSLLTCLRSSGLPMPESAVFISPWADLECKGGSHETNSKKDPMLTTRMLKRTARLYTDQDLSSALISPVNGDFSGICPCLIQVGENEILLDDSKILAKKIESAGSHVNLEIWENMFHVWHYFARYLPEAEQAIQHMGDFIKKSHQN
jgi:acetyl esterase/lipase